MNTTTLKNGFIRKILMMAVIIIFTSGLANAGVCSLGITATVVHPTCYGSCNASVTNTITGGSGNYSYQWSSGATTKDLGPVCAGVYTLTVTDLNNWCTKTRTFNLKKSKVSATTTNTPAHCGLCNGTITAVGKGGNGAPFTYLWSTGATTSTLNNVCPNVFYTVTVTDKMGCTFVCKRKTTNVGNTVSDNNVCTTDACDPATGQTTYTPIDIDDNNVCTTDACDPVTGQSHTPVDPDDQNECTTDGCNPETGPYHTPVNTNDNNPCTTDGCDPVTGPYHTPNNSCCNGNFTTYTQGGWHNTGTPGTYLSNNFDGCAANFILGDPCGFTITFTSAAEIKEFLPQGTGPAALTASSVDPGSANITVLAGQVLSVGLALLFDDCDPNFSSSQSDLGAQIYDVSGSPFDGWSVQAIYNEASRVLSGCPSLYTPDQMNIVTTDINEEYDEGGTSSHFDCPGVSRLASSANSIEQRATAQPNPFQDKLQISIQTEEPLTLKIMDVEGRLLNEMKNVSNSVEISDLVKAGIYFIQLSNESGSYQQILKVLKSE